MTNFDDTLLQAKEGDKQAMEDLYQMYRPMLIKNALDFGVFDEDLYQELCHTLLLCIRKFRVPDSCLSKDSNV